MSVADIAKAAGVNLDCVYKHIAAGHISTTKLPGFRQHMVQESELAAFLKARANGKFVRKETVGKA